MFARIDRSRLGSWGGLILGILVLFGMPDPALAITRVDAVRIWPADAYTRVTFESRTPLQSRLFSVTGPDRLVLDFDDMTATEVLRHMAVDLKPDDPYIRAVRVGHFKPGVVRLVFDLKTPVEASSSLLVPVGDYGYRLVLDLYPKEGGPDPLAGLLQGTPGAPPPGDSAKSAPAQSGGMPAIPGSVPASAAAVAQPVAPSGVAGAPVTPEPPTPRPAGRSAIESALPPSLGLEAAPLAGHPMLVVAVDAGHGGEDPGAHGEGGTHEKNVTLAIARRLKALIDEQPGMRATLTRDGDYFIPLQERTAIAHRRHADLFVSIHADAYINREARGSSVFALSEKGATSVAARWIAHQQNQADLIGGVNLNHHDHYLSQTLFDLSQTATINDSLKMAHAVLDQLDAVNVLHRGFVEQAGFAVLKSPDIPSILVETAFITNPEEEHRLNDPGYQETLARAILKGLQGYLATHPALLRTTPVKRSDLPGESLVTLP